MKMNKIAISLVVLSATGIAALTSCGGGASPAQKPGVYVYARTGLNKENWDDESGEEMPSVYKDTVFYEDKILTYTIDDVENLKYNPEKDVVVHIKPNLFFHLTEGYNSDTWLAEGEPVIPYVGLGSPTNRFNYPLPMGLAWTYEREDVQDPTNAAEKTESYKLTIKKEYFQKNVVVGYGYGQTGCVEEDLKNYATVIESDYYQGEGTIRHLSMNSIDELIKKKAGESFELPKNDMNTAINYDHDDLVENSDFSVASKGMTLHYEGAASATGGGFLKNSLVTFESIPNTFNGDETEYAEIKVVGVKLDSEGKIALNDVLSKATDDSGFVVKSAGTFTDGIRVFIDWHNLVANENYDQKYDYIFVGMDPIYACEVSTTHTGDDITCVNYGYSYDSNVKIKDEAGKDFSNHPFAPGFYAIQTGEDTTNGEPKYEIRNGMSPAFQSSSSSSHVGYNNFSPYNTVESLNGRAAPYFVTFKYNQGGASGGTKWPKVSISYTNKDGATSSLTINTDAKAIGTYTNEDTLTSIVEYATELTGDKVNLNNAKWVLVHNVTDGTEAFKGTDEFVLYPTYNAELSAFITPTEWSLAKSISINIAAK